MVDTVGKVNIIFCNIIINFYLKLQVLDVIVYLDIDQVELKLEYIE